LAGWDAPPSAGTNLAAEARELTRRSAEFVTLGQWDEALALAEASLPIDGGADVLWTSKASVLLVEKEGEAECILHYNTPNVNAQSVAYDGKYVWATAVFGSDKRLPEVWVVDPRSKQRWQITAAHGLPLHSSKMGTIETRGHQMVMVAAVSPGKAIIAGAFGRTWLASVTFDPKGNHDVNVFHEARQIGGDHPKLTTAAFIPWYMATLKPPPSHAATTGTRLLIGRSMPGRGDCTPLLVDVDSLTVQAQPNRRYQRLRSDVYRGVRVWNMKTGRSTLIETIHEIAGFLPDGTLAGCTHGFPRRLVAWDVDRGTYRRLWDEVIGELIGVSPDGRYLHTIKIEGGLEGHRGQVRRLRVWDLASHRLVVANREHEAVKFMSQTPHRVFIDRKNLSQSNTSAKR